jgi:hypothetical protein
MLHHLIRCHHQQQQCQTAPSLVAIRLLVGKKMRVELLRMFAGKSTGPVLLTTTTYSLGALKELLAAIAHVFGPTSSIFGAGAIVINDAIINDKEDKGRGFIHLLEDHRADLLMQLAEGGITRDLHMKFKTMRDIFGAKMAKEGATSTSGLSLGEG